MFVLDLGMCGIDFLISVRFWFSFKKKLGFGSEWVWFGSVQKNSVRFGYYSYLLLMYSCNSRYYSDSGWHDFTITDITHKNDNK